MADLKCHQPLLKPFVKDEPLTAAEVSQVKALLVAHKSLDLFPGKVAGTGLFSAAMAGGHGGDQGNTGYNNVWVRDNIFLAHSLYTTDAEGKGIQAAIDVCASLCQYFLKFAARFDDIISGKADKSDPMQRPHIRFNGDNLAENTEFWNHKQNDALGYFLWMRCKLCMDGVMPMTGDHLRLLGLLCEYLAKIEYWCDEDNGHWEEATKVEASSVGPVVAGVKEFKKVLSSNKGMLAPCSDGTIEVLVARGEEALAAILPNECIQEGKKRDSDGALIFLVYPLDVVSESMAKQIVDITVEKITGPIGIRRYNGDSYWCKDYKDKTGSDATKAFTDEEMKERDKLVVQGEEAQWCIFDPIMSAIYGKWYQSSKDPEMLKLQQKFLARSLAQVTGEGTGFGPWLCPESYYLCKGEWVPSDICPLLWTQANLAVALFHMEESVTMSSKKRPAGAQGGVMKKPAKA